jgi:hypothetical protein
MSWHSSVQRRTTAARSAAQQEQAAAANAPANRPGGVFQNPFARRSTSGANGGVRHAEPLGSHVRNLAGAQVCPASRQQGGSLSVSVDAQPRSVEKKKEKGFGLPGPFDDIARKGIDFAGDVVKAGGRLVVGSAEVIVDAGAKTINFVGDIATDSPKALGGVLKFAAENGLKLAGNARAAARDFVRDRIDDAFDIGGRIDKLGVNDSYSLGGGVSAALGIGGGASGAVEVKRTRDGYSVSSELNASLSAGIEVNGEAGIGGKAEFKFKNAADAKRAALILLGVNASAASPLLAPALLPSGREASFLKGHLSSVEVSATVAGKVDNKFGAGPLEAGVEAGVGAETVYRLEFKGGKPTALVRSTSFSLNAGADAALKLVEKPLGSVAGDRLKAAVTKGGEASGTVTVETRLSLDSAKLPDVAQLLSNPTAAAFVGGAETTVKASFLLDAGDQGFELLTGASGLSGGEARHVVNQLVQGRVGEAFAGVGVEPFASVDFFRDNGLNAHIDAKFANVGFDVRGYSESRDVRAHFAVGGN